MKKKIFVLVATTLALSSPLSVLAECQHNNDQWEVLYKADCEDEGVETRYCSVCHEYQRRSIPKTAHVFSNWKVSEKATKFSEGTLSRYCIYCDEEEYKTIPKKKMTKAEKKVKKVVDSFYSAAKKYDVKKMRKCFVRGSDLKVFVEYKQMASFCKKYNKRLRYEFRSLSVKRNRATVKVYCRYPDASFAVEKALIENKYYFLDYPDDSAADFRNAVYKDILFNIDYDDDFSLWGETITFKLVKKGSSWKIEKPNFKMTDSINCGYESGYKYAF